jgi:hypothetical protein
MAFFVIGFHRDSDAPVKIRIIAPDGSVKTSLWSPRQRDYNIQRIDGTKINNGHAASLQFWRESNLMVMRFAPPASAKRRLAISGAVLIGQPLAGFQGSMAASAF